MENKNNKDLCEYFISALINNDWAKINAIFTFSNGSYGLKVRYLDKSNQEFSKVLKASEWGKKADYLFDLFKSNSENAAHRFNKVEFEVNRDDSYTVNYHWDEAEDKDQKFKTAEVFPIWLHERFLQFLFEAGYGDNTNWQKGVFKTHIDKEGKINMSVVLYNRDIPFNADPKFPNYVYEAILQHHEITNNGLLDDVFKKWDTLIIHSRYTSVDLEKDVEYHLES